MFSTSQVDFFVFKPNPYSLIFAVKFFTSTKGKKGRIMAVTSSTISFTTLATTLVTRLSVGSKRHIISD